MYEIPLFPLNTVLFPGNPLHLHIFEERYKRMVSFCRKTNSPFGVVNTQKGIESSDSSDNLFTIGCSAQITHIQPLEQGRMNIVALGLERFQIHTTRSDLPYLIGVVEPFPIEIQESEGLMLAVKDLQPWLKRYSTQLNKVEGINITLPELVIDPLSYAYVAAMILQIPIEEKQQLLEINHPVSLVNDLHRIYRREIAINKVMLQKDVRNHEIHSSFSVN